MNKTVAILDDSPIVIDATKGMLEPLGWKVVDLGRAMTAPMVIMREAPAIVLVDVNMPVINGGEFIKFVKAKVNLSVDIKFVLYSGASARELRTLARETGSNGYICKTQNAADLDRALQALLR